MYERLFGGTEVLLWCCHDFQTGSQHQSFEPQPIKLGWPPTNDMQLVDSKGWSKTFQWFRMLWHPLESMFNCCELKDCLPGLIVQKWKLSMLAESTYESFNRTVLPFTLEAKGTEACYFQLRQDFRLTRILTMCMQGQRSFQTANWRPVRSV